MNKNMTKTKVGTVPNMAKITNMQEISKTSKGNILEFRLPRLSTQLSLLLKGNFRLTSSLFKVLQPDQAGPLPV
jgi:hypothetical protein